MGFMVSDKVNFTVWSQVGKKYSQNVRMTATECNVLPEAPLLMGFFETPKTRRMSASIGKQE